MKILMLSWRDIHNPLAGGAERVTYELLRRWSGQHDCFWFCSAYKGCLDKEEIEGIKIIRRGSRIKVYLEAYKYLKDKKFDMVIDQINTIPFFTPLYYKGKKISFFHQLCEKVWFYETSFPLSLIGFIAEKIYVRLYKKLPCLVVSESTKKNLIKYDFRDIYVMKDCIDFKPLPTVPQKKHCSLVYVGRLKKSKRVHDIIKAFSIIKKEIPSASLHIVGKGEKKYQDYLTRLMKNLGIEIFFHGYVPKEERNRLMSQAEAILVASVKEGWGLIVIEANALGTPAIVYNVDGLRDSVKPMITGLITRKNTPEELAKSVLSFFQDSALKRQLSLNTLNYSRTFDWDESADNVLNWLSA
jgi:glycosyltransferase involved in cell wall biosynthesis